MRPDVRQRHLILAAVAAGAAGLALVALGWWIVDWQARSDWARLSDPSWWAGDAVRLLGHLVISGVGFKVALAAVVGLGAGFAWLRVKHRRQAESGDETPPAV
jgi:hypothetical protein